MDSIIHVNTATRMAAALARTAPRSPELFGDTLENAAAAAEAYRQSVAAQVALMPVHPSRAGDHFEISISTAGYAAMQADPEYEQFVLDTIRRELATPNPLQTFTGSSTLILRFGSEARHFRADSFPHGDSAQDIMNKADEKSWWEERQERQAASRELDQKIADLRSAARRMMSAKLQRGESVSAADLSAASEIMSLLLTELLGGLQT